MKRFYLGLHHPCDAWPFLRSMISVNTLRARKRDFRVNSWIMDSGAFTELSLYGRYRYPVDEYINQIERWRVCGRLQAVVSQDYMCEPFILSKTGMTVEEHQALTIERYREITQWVDEVYVMPVLQGYTPADYVRHITEYGDLLGEGAWAGVGSVCKRNGDPLAIEQVLLAIKIARPDLRLHGFGIKLTALSSPVVRDLLYSSDSMAWSFSGRAKGEGDQNDPRRALAYAAVIEDLLNNREFNPQLYKWWVD